MTITVSSAISTSEGVRKSLSPQNAPRITAYTAEKQSPKSKILNTDTARESEKRKVKFCANGNKINVKGRVKSRQSTTPAPTAECFSLALFFAFALEMKRDTLTGIPLVPKVKNMAKREREI